MRPKYRPWIPQGYSNILTISPKRGPLGPFGVSGDLS